MQSNIIKIGNLCNYVLDDKRSQSCLCIARICNEYGIVWFESGLLRSSYELRRSQMSAHYKQSISLYTQHCKIQLCLELMDCIHNVLLCCLNKQKGPELINKLTTE